MNKLIELAKKYKKYIVILIIALVGLVIIALLVLFSLLKDDSKKDSSKNQNNPDSLAVDDSDVQTEETEQPAGNDEKFIKFTKQISLVEWYGDRTFTYDFEFNAPKGSRLSVLNGDDKSTIGIQVNNSDYELTIEPYFEGGPGFYGSTPVKVQNSFTRRSIYRARPASFSGGDYSRYYKYVDSMKTNCSDEETDLVPESYATQVKACGSEVVTLSKTNEFFAVSCVVPEGVSADTLKDTCDVIMQSIKVSVKK